MLKTVLPILVALSIPASASAATVGGDPGTATPDQLVSCPEYPCTLPIGPIPAGSTITSFSGYFADSSYVQVEIQRDGQWEGSGGAFTTGAGVQSFDSEVRVPSEGNYTVGLTVYEGAAAKVRVTYDPPQAQQPDPTPVPSEPTPVPSHGGGNDDDPAPVAAAYAIKPKGILGSEAQPYFKVFTRTGGNENVDVRMQLEVGGKVVSTQTADDRTYGAADTFYMHVSPKVRKRVIARGTLKATAIARVTGTRSGRTKTYRGTVKLLRGGDARYDGTYRGDGPVVVVVKRGVVTAVSQTLNLFCPRSNSFMTRSMETVTDQMPALVSRSGAFSAKGSSGWDTFTYKGKLSRTGTSKGYFSLFHTNVTFGEHLQSEDCYQASNWTAKRS